MGVATINVFPITLPPLRRRREDIPELVRHFLEKYQPGSSITPEAMAKLRAYDWPGNVRELENVIERALIMAGDRPVDVDDLPFHVHEAPATPDNLFDIPDEGINLEEVEKKLLYSAIDKAQGNKSRAAKLLGITRRKLYSMLERFGGETRPSAFVVAAFDARGRCLEWWSTGVLEYWNTGVLFNGVVIRWLADLSSKQLGSGSREDVSSMTDYVPISLLQYSNTPTLQFSNPRLH